MSNVYSCSKERNVILYRIILQSVGSCLFRGNEWEWYLRLCQQNASKLVDPGSISSLQIHCLLTNFIFPWAYALPECEREFWISLCGIIRLQVRLCKERACWIGKYFSFRKLNCPYPCKELHRSYQNCKQAVRRTSDTDCSPLSHISNLRIFSSVICFTILLLITYYLSVNSVELLSTDQNMIPASNAIEAHKQGFVANVELLLSIVEALAQRTRSLNATRNAWYFSLCVVAKLPIAPTSSTPVIPATASSPPAQHHVNT
jgi:hypothetical protein